MSLSLSDRYEARVAEGLIEGDPAQRHAIESFERLRRELETYEPAGKPSGLARFFGAGRRAEAAPLGLYVWGSVGRGKSMLMDLFYEAAPPLLKTRSHFHAFMAGVHARVHAFREAARQKKPKNDDPIAAVADEIAAKTTLLCFDEFHVTDITDAMLLGRLFDALFARGVVIVATSNVEPKNLYRDGLNRALFLPFIDLIMKKMEVLELVSRTDYRREKLEGRRTWHAPADETAQAALTGAFEALTGAPSGKPMALHVLGRALPVPEARAHVARFAFSELCERPLGATDYLAIARAFHTLVVDDIPVIAPARRDVAKRFILLVDALYEEHVKLIASAAAQPAQIYQGDGREGFEFARTVSRLVEMRSSAYLDLPHGPVASQGSGDASGLVET
ncbi:cell division protein ZapE [Methylocella sp.]|uniref:cell division protein ZapE n=1 Tax=Methylocella sp. TaxID=1978226 RepID=UPI003784A141